LAIPTTIKRENRDEGISALAMLGRAGRRLPAGAETVKLTLLGVGDVYNFEEEDGRGGFARLNAVARASARRTRTRFISSTATCCRPRCLGLRQGAEHHRFHQPGAL
jgi:hypothetical protein